MRRRDVSISRAKPHTRPLPARVRSATPTSFTRSSAARVVTAGERWQRSPEAFPLRLPAALGKQTELRTKNSELRTRKPSLSSKFRVLRSKNQSSEFEGSPRDLLRHSHPPRPERHRGRMRRAVLAQRQDRTADERGDQAGCAEVFVRCVRLVRARQAAVAVVEESVDPGGHASDK